MAVELNRTWWRKALAIGVLPFAALGVTGCDNAQTREGGGDDQEVTTDTGETVDDDATTEPMSPTEGEGPAEDDNEG